MLREAASQVKAARADLTSALDVGEREVGRPHIALVSTRSLDGDRVESAVEELLCSLGVEIGAEDVRDTPRRVAAMYGELLSPEPVIFTTFANTEGYDELVIVRDIPLVSLCAHHLLPFTGRAHVAYVPGERIVGLSKLARVVRHFAKGLQVQERLTKQVADLIQRELRPKGVGVVIEAEHQCMTIRGVQATGTKTLTSALHGLLRDNSATRAEFLSLTRIGMAT
jgi:GTP cyclohydrolase IA